MQHCTPLSDCDIFWLLLFCPNMITCEIGAISEEMENKRGEKNWRRKEKMEKKGER